MLTYHSLSHEQLWHGVINKYSLRKVQYGYSVCGDEGDHIIYVTCPRTLQYFPDG